MDSDVQVVCHFKSLSDSDEIAGSAYEQKFSQGTEDCTNYGQMSSSDLELPPGGVITTCSSSAVIKPGSNSKSRDPLKFVKIQTAELSKTAVEQIRLAEEVKVTKEKIKEVEEEWQSNLLNWKSKRRQSKEGSAPNGGGSESGQGDDDSNSSSNGKPRKIKTFSEILNEKAKSGQRLGYNLQRYVEGEEDPTGLGLFSEAQAASEKSRSHGAHNPSVHSENRNDYDFERTQSSEEDDFEMRSCHEEANNQRNENVNGASEQHQSIRDSEAVGTSQKYSNGGVGGGKPQANGNLAERGDGEGCGRFEGLGDKQARSAVENDGSYGKQPGLTVGAKSEVSGGRSSGGNGLSESSVGGGSSNNRIGGNDQTNNEQQRNERNVWGYLLDQQMQQTGDNLKRIHSEPRPSLSDYEDDMFNESLETDDLAQQQQMINFKAKLSAFENLAKQPNQEQLSQVEQEAAVTASRRGQGDGHRAKSSAVSSGINQNNGRSQQYHQERRPPVSERPVAVGAEDQSSSKIPTAAAQRVPPPSTRDLIHCESQRNERPQPPLNQQQQQLATRFKGHQVYNTAQVQQQQPQQSISQVCQTVQLSQQQDFSDYDLQMDRISGRLARSQIKLAAPTTSSTGVSNLNHGGHHDQQQQPASHTMCSNNGYNNDQFNSSNAASSHSRSQRPPQVGMYYSPDHEQQLYANQQQPPLPPLGQMMYDQQQYFYLEDNFGVQQSSTLSSPSAVQQMSQLQLQEPLYSNNQQEQLQYLQQLSGGYVSSGNEHNSSLQTKLEHVTPPTTSTTAMPSSQPQQHQLSSLYYPKPYSHSKLPQPQQKLQQPKQAMMPPHQIIQPVPSPLAQQQQQAVYKPVPQPRPFPDPVAATAAVAHPGHGGQSQIVPATKGHSLSSDGQGVGYNRSHWLIQEAELRRQIAATASPVKQPRVHQGKVPPPPPPPQPLVHPASTLVPQEQIYENMSQAQLAAQQKQNMLSVSGRKKCSSCGDELGRGCAAMVIESLSLFYHINCFRCSVCHVQLGNGTCGTDVRVRNHKLHCNNCYSNDEAGLKFSRV